MSLYTLLILLWFGDWACAPGFGVCMVLNCKLKHQNVSNLIGHTFTPTHMHLSFCLSDKISSRDKVSWNKVDQYLEKYVAYCTSQLSWSKIDRKYLFLSNLGMLKHNINNTVCV